MFFPLFYFSARLSKLNFAQTQRYMIEVLQQKCGDDRETKSEIMIKVLKYATQQKYIKQATVNTTITEHVGKPNPTLHMQQNTM
jgi:hypothetical protein